MSIFLRGSQRKPRRFSYDPKYYDPRKEEDLRQRIRIKSQLRHRRRSPAGIVLFMILLGMLLFVYSRLG